MATSCRPRLKRAKRLKLAQRQLHLILSHPARVWAWLKLCESDGGRCNLWLSKYVGFVSGLR